ncbi:MAG: hypothetical protein EPN82_10820 [Bacteroidetes bacterium]|nr:MAG: hypothetical protein EPN82_10820 [Bacteroidota bacterium]
MKKYLLFLLFTIVVSSQFWGCISYSRTETDIYTISEMDTTTSYIDKNAPGNRDNGIIYSSSRTVESKRDLIQRDSTVTREYPNFIRLGLFESVGLIGSGSNYAAGMGMFGVFPDFENLKTSYTGGTGKIFSGGLYRFGVVEWRLRWFRDAKDWTYGTSGLEIIMPDARTEYALASIAPLYIRKRWFLREQIPYIAITAHTGIGWYPSQYLNLAGSIDVGSIGGLNVRAYLGLAAGQNPKGSPQVKMSPAFNSSTIKSVTSVFPYFGIGISVLDFLNRVPETYREWKDHEHSSWDIGLTQMILLNSGASSIYNTNNSSTLLTGYILRLANASVALPLLDWKLYAGTSLINFIVLGNDEWGMGILPLRLGIWQTVIMDELSVEPFIEYNYYPSEIFHLGGRLNLRVTEGINLGLAVGYASGSTVRRFGSDMMRQLGKPMSFSRPYIGLSIGIFDRIFFPEHLRYFKDK